MAEINASAPYVTTVSTMDVAEEQSTAVLAALIDRANGERGAPGFVSASVLRRRSSEVKAGGEAPIARLIEYTQWESEASDRRFRGASRPDALTDVSELLVGNHSETYMLDAVISAADRLYVRTSDPRLTLMVVMDPRDEKQAFVNKYNQTETSEFIAKFAGFVGAAFHLAPSGRVLEYVQWESTEAMAAATATDRFRLHFETNARHCLSTDFGVYDVMHSVSARAPLVTEQRSNHAWQGP